MNKINTPIRYKAMTQDFLDASECTIPVEDVVDALNTATAREARLVEALELIAGDYTDSWDNGWGYAENKRDMALEALAEHRGEL